MGQPIKSNEIIEGNALVDFIAKGETALEVMKGLRMEFIELAKVQKKVMSGSDGLKKSKDIEAFRQAVNKTNEALRETQKLEKEEIRLQTKLESLESQRAKDIEAVRLAVNKRKKELREEAILNQKVGNEYQKASLILRKLKRQYQDLAVAQGENSKQARKLAEEIRKEDARLKSINKTIGDNFGNVGNYSSALNGLNRSFRNLAGALGVTTGIVAFGRALKGAFNTAIDFEKAGAELAGVLDTNLDGVSKLTEDAIRLGSETAKTATEVTALQIAYSRLGFEQEQVLALTEPTINGSIALNASLEETANLTGAIVNSFDDFAATDAPEILDVLTVATQKSALNFEQLQSAIPNVAGAANAAGIPFNRLVALLGKLSDSGIDASKSSTALRNIFIEAEAQGLDYGQILDKIKDSTGKLTTATDEFGKRASVSASILANNIEKTAELEEKLDDAGGTAAEVAETQLDTLAGSLQLLSSAWEGFILRISNGTGVLGGLKDVVKFVAVNLESILKVVKTAAIAWGSYRIALKLVNQETGKFKKFGLVGFFKKIIAGLVSLTKGTKGAAAGFRSIGSAIKSIPLVGWIAGITTAIPLMWDFVKSGNAAAIAQERLNGALERGAENIKKQNEAANSALSKRIELEKQSLKTRLRTVKSAQDQRKAIARSAQSLKAFASVEIKKLDESIAKRKEEARTIGRTSEADRLRRVEIAEELTQLNATRAKFADLQANAENEAANIFIDLQKTRKKARDENKKEEQKEAGEVLTRLQRLKKELAEQNKLKEKALNIEGGQKSLEFANAKARAKNLSEEIELLEFVLKLKDKRVESLKLEKKDTEELKQEIFDKNAQQIEDELNLLNIEKDARNKAAEEEKKRQQDLFDNVKILANTTFEFLDRLSDKQLQILDKQMNSQQKRLDNLQAKAAVSRLDLTESVAAEEKRLEELDARRAKIEKQKQRRQAFITGLGILESKVKDNETGALSKTFSDLIKLSSFVTSLPTFYEGTENVSATDASMILNTVKDPFVVRVHPNERILSEKQNQRIPRGMSNEQLVDAASLYKTGFIDQPVYQSSSTDTFALAAMTKAITDSNKKLLEKPTYLGGDFDSAREAWVLSIKKAGALEKRALKINRAY